MKIAVTGASGMLGSIICRKSKDEIYGTYNNGIVKNVVPIKMDVTSKEEVKKTFEKIKPDWVIHCAGIVSNELCNANPKLAWSVNVNGTKNISEACIKHGTSMLYVSTGNVFDGLKGFYKEDDKTNPIAVYGKTKLEGEIFTQNVDKHIIVRMSLLYGAGGRFFDNLIGNLKLGKRTEVVEGNYLSPTFNEDAANAILNLIKKSAFGVCHVAADRMSRIEFSKKVANFCGFDNSLIVPVKSMFGGSIRRSDHSLNPSKSVKLGIKYTPMNLALKSIRI